MRSHAYRRWNSTRARELDHIEAAYLQLKVSGVGGRASTQQVIHAYVVLLAAHFQGFCRDLHTECVDYLIVPIPGVDLQEAARKAFLRDRSLERGNANQATIGGDFSRLGVANFWGLVDVQQTGNNQRRQLLDLLNTWRNAIAHQDFDPARLGGTTHVPMTRVRGWRRACRKLALDMDEVTRVHVHSLTGAFPW